MIQMIHIMKNNVKMQEILKIAKWNFLFLIFDLFLTGFVKFTPLSILQECQQHSTPNIDHSSFIH